MRGSFLGGDRAKEPTRDTEALGDQQEPCHPGAEGAGEKVVSGALRDLELRRRAGQAGRVVLRDRPAAERDRSGGKGVEMALPCSPAPCPLISC